MLFYIYGQSWQFFGVRVSGLSVLWLHEAWSSCLCHITADRADVEAATLNQTNVAVSLLSSLQVSLLNILNLNALRTLIVAPGIYLFILRFDLLCHECS